MLPPIAEKLFLYFSDLFSLNNVHYVKLRNWMWSTIFEWMNKSDTLSNGHKLVYNLDWFAYFDVERNIVMNGL